MCLLSISPLSSAVKRQFQLQVAEVFPLFSSAPKMEALSEEQVHTPLSTERDSSDMLLSAEHSSAITRQFLKLWSWYEVSLLKLVIGIQLGSNWNPRLWKDSSTLSRPEMTVCSRYIPAILLSPGSSDS